jgi:hypothetical protein
MSSLKLRTRVRQIFLVSLLSAPGFAQELEAPQDLASIHREKIAEIYGLSSWPKGEPRIGLANGLALEGWTAVDLQAVDGFLTRRFKRTEPETDAISFVVESHVAQTPRAAHQDLLGWLASLQSPQQRPALGELGPAIGDVGYFSRSGAGPGALAWIAFVRGNVAVRVLAFDARQEPDLDLAGVAREIDRALLATATIPRGTKLPRPVVRKLASEFDEVVAGERVRLELEITDPHGGVPHLRWMLVGPGRGYVERGKDGELYLFTTAPGPMELKLEVTGSMGTTTRASVGLKVLED